MPELADLRAMLKDRQLKEGALGTCESTICLDIGLIDQLKELEAERAAQGKATTPAADVRLGSPAPEDTSEPSDLDIQIDQLTEQVNAASLKIIFRALSSVRYQAVLNDHPDANEEGLEPFLNDLAGACFHECRGLDGSKVDVTWPELREAITYGEWEPISAMVLAMNRRKVDVPFSSTPSRKTH